MFRSIRKLFSFRSKKMLATREKKLFRVLRSFYAAVKQFLLVDRLLVREGPSQLA